jgi:hypothetical protein
MNPFGGFVERTTPNWSPVKESEIKHPSWRRAVTPLSGAVADKVAILPVSGGKGGHSLLPSFDFPIRRSTRRGHPRHLIRDRDRQRQLIHYPTSPIAFGLEDIV